MAQAIQPSVSPASVAFVSPKADIPEQVHTYRPRGRSIEFLAMAAKLVGAVVPDMKSSDVLVFGGTAETCAKVRKLLDDIDRPSQAYMVRGSLLEFTVSDSSVRSLNLALSAFAGKLGLALSAGAKQVNALSFTGSNLTAVLSAIDSDSRFRYVAEPQIRVMEGQEAKLTVGEEVPTRGAATLDKNGNPIASIQYRQAGVVITVKPQRTEDGIVLTIGQQVSSFGATTTSDIDSPTVFKREAQTTVTAKPGEVIMLAGMDSTRETGSRSGLAFLPEFMHSKNNESNRSQMVLLLEVQTMDESI